MDNKNNNQNNENNGKNQNRMANNSNGRPPQRPSQRPVQKSAQKPAKNHHSKSKKQKYNSNLKKKSYVGRYITLAILVLIILACSIAYAVVKGNDNSDKDPKKTTQSSETTKKNESIKPSSSETSATILSTGDILIHQSLLDGANQGNGQYDFTKSFQYVKDIVSGADFAVCNLEVTFGGTQKKYSSFPLFNTPDSLADALKSAGFDMLVTANNHSYDSQELGLRRTPQVIQEKGLLSTGTRSDDTQKSYAVKEVNGIKFGFLNYTYETPSDSQGRKALNGNFLTAEAGGLVNSFNYDKLDSFYAEAKTKIDEMKKDGAEVVMMYIHWGTEYQTTPNDYQKTIAKKMCDLGVNVLVGGHPHVIQPVETITSQSTGNKMVCLYSSGNALSNQRISLMDLKTGHTEDGIMFLTTFKKDKSGNVTLEKIDYIPTWVNIAKIGTKNIHQIIPLNNIMNSTDNLGLTAETAQSAKKSFERTNKLVASGIEEYNNSVSGKSSETQTQKDAA